MIFWHKIRKYFPREVYLWRNLIIYFTISWWTFNFIIFARRQKLNQTFSAILCQYYGELKRDCEMNVSRNEWMMSRNKFVWYYLMYWNTLEWFLKHRECIFRYVGHGIHGWLYWLARSSKIIVCLCVIGMRRGFHNIYVATFMYSPLESWALGVTWVVTI